MNFFDFGEIINSDSQFAIFGIPWDYLTSIKAPNSSQAPQKIREVTENLALTTEFGYYIPNMKAVDIGDIEIESENVDKNLNVIRNFIKDIYIQNPEVILIMIGGDHFCSFPVIKAVGDNVKAKEEFGILSFDSHLDFYEEWDKGVYSHATVSHRVFDLDYINNKNLLIVGTRDIDIPELENAKKEGIGYLDAYLIAEIGIKNYVNKIISFYKKSNIKNLYVSIDIDAFDPSIAPGTGFAIPGGFSYREMWQILRELTNHFNIQAFDVVEVAPNLDLPNNITSNLAAKLIVEFMSFIANKN